MTGKSRPDFPADDWPEGIPGTRRRKQLKRRLYELAELKVPDHLKGRTVEIKIDGNYVTVERSRYVIADRIGTVTEIVPHVVGANGRPTGQRGLIMYWRVGANVVDSNAFRLLDIPTTA